MVSGCYTSLDRPLLHDTPVDVTWNTDTPIAGPLPLPLLLKDYDSTLMFEHADNGLDGHAGHVSNLFDRVWWLLLHVNNSQNSKNAEHAPKCQNQKLKFM